MSTVEVAFSKNLFNWIPYIVFTERGSESDGRAVIELEMEIFIHGWKWS